MSTQYEIWLTRDDGTRLAHLNDNTGFSYTWVANNIGAWWLELPDRFDRSLATIDTRVQFWRRPVGGRSTLDFQGLVRRRESKASEDGSRVRLIGGPDFMWLLEGAACAYLSDGTASRRVDYADDLIKAIVRDNRGADVVQANRALSADYFSVAADASLGPQISLGFQGRNVLAVAREIAEAARKAGTAVFFDIVPDGDRALQLETYTGQRGQDRTGDSGLIFSARRGNLRQPRLIEDWTQEVNYIWITGGGVGLAKRFLSYEAQNRVGTSLWSRREAFVIAPSSPSSAELQAVALAGLAQGRPSAVFTGELVSVDNTRDKVATVYGRDWGRGDLVRVDDDGQQFDFMPRAITVAVDRVGRETVSAIGEAYLEYSADQWRAMDVLTGAPT